MTALRAVIALFALIAAIAGLLIEQPEVFAISSSSALVIFLVGCGAIAADALPLQRVPLVCSILTVPLAVLLFRPFEVTPIAVAILVLQAVAWWASRRQRSARDADASGAAAPVRG